jgi:predicted Rossmann fold nucleotide-binding protein DprA/Smf involved in DNA uptake
LAVDKKSINDCNDDSSGDCLMGVMVTGQPYDLDELIALSGLDAQRLLPRLLDLELGGRVRRAGGGRFFRSF